LALGFATALWATLATDAGMRIFLIASAIAWVAWEFFLGPRAPSESRTPGALVYGALTGLAFPWIGFLLATLAAWLRP
jgi:hypothetical protein